MTKVVSLVALLAGAVLVLAGVVLARNDSTSEGAAGATAVLGVGVVLVIVAAVAAFLGRRRSED